MFQPVSLIFRFLQNNSTICIWLFDHSDIKIQGVLIGFDEFMNMVLNEAVELSSSSSKPPCFLGKIMLKGDNISLIHAV